MCYREHFINGADFAYAFLQHLELYYSKILLLCNFTVISFCVESCKEKIKTKQEWSLFFFQNDPHDSTKNDKINKQ